MNQVLQMLQKLERERFYGTVSLQYKAGNLELIRKEETIKPTYEGTTQHARTVSK